MGISVPPPSLQLFQSRQGRTNECYFCRFLATSNTMKKMSDLEKVIMMSDVESLIEYVDIWLRSFLLEQEFLLYFLVFAQVVVILKVSHFKSRFFSSDFTII